MQAEGYRHRRALLRALDIDLVVHQGHGAAAIFRDDDTVFTLSLHGAPGQVGRDERMQAMSERPHALPRSHFPRFETLSTRWMDNDVYGHLNNVVHYSLFDTAVNRTLIAAGALDIHAGAVIGLVVHTQCHYFESLAFPQTVHAGLRVLHRGRSSVRYEIGLFGDDAPLSAAVGQFTHVYVDRATRRPVSLPPALLNALAALEGPTATTAA